MIAVKRSLGNMQIFGGDAVFFHLFRQQMSHRNLAFFFLRIAGETNHFHAIAQRRLNRVQHVCRRHEDHVRQIKRYAEIVVAEAVVLFRIENFEQG